MFNINVTLNSTTIYQLRYCYSLGDKATQKMDLLFSHIIKADLSIISYACILTTLKVFFPSNSCKLENMAVFKHTLIIILNAFAKLS